MKKKANAPRPKTIPNKIMNRKRVAPRELRSWEFFGRPRTSGEWIRLGSNAAFGEAMAQELCALCAKPYGKGFFAELTVKDITK